MTSKILVKFGFELHRMPLCVTPYAAPSWNGGYAPVVTLARYGKPSLCQYCNPTSDFWTL